MGSHSLQQFKHVYIQKIPKRYLFLQKELPPCSTGNNVLNSFMHGSRILSLNPKFTSSVIKQKEYCDEEILKKVNKKYYTPTKFSNALNELRTKKQNL